MSVLPCKDTCKLDEEGKKEMPPVVLELMAIATELATTLDEMVVRMNYVEQRLVNLENNKPTNS